MIAAERGISINEAFEVLRNHARSHNANLRSVACRHRFRSLRPLTVGLLSDRS